jgi:hypothetical protein
VVWWCGFKDRDTATSDLKIKTRKDVDSAREEQDTLARSLSLSLPGRIIWESRDLGGGTGGGLAGKPPRVFLSAAQHMKA